MQSSKFVTISNSPHTSHVTLIDQRVAVCCRVLQCVAVQWHESWHTCQGVMSHLPKSDVTRHVTRTNQSCHKNERGMSHVSCHTYQKVTSHTWTWKSHVIGVKNPCDTSCNTCDTSYATHERVRLYVPRSHVTHYITRAIKSCHTHERFVTYHTLEWVTWHISRGFVTRIQESYLGY